MKSKTDKIQRTKKKQIALPLIILFLLLTLGSVLAYNFIKESNCEIQKDVFSATILNIALDKINTTYNGNCNDECKLDLLGYLEVFKNVDKMTCEEFKEFKQEILQ
jgi:hypothetical protein